MQGGLRGDGVWGRNFGQESKTIGERQMKGHALFKLVLKTCLHPDQEGSSR